MTNRMRLETLFCLGMFIFWTFTYPHHILFKEQLSLFLYSSDFLQPYILRPGGWAAYIGDFLAQFYINRWTGALIQTSLMVAILKIMEGILKKAGGNRGLSLRAIIPAMLLAVLQLDKAFTPGDALALICPFALTLLYMNISRAMLRRIVFAIAIVPVYLFSGAAATCCLYLACALYELLFANDKWKYLTPVWTIVAFCLPFVWQKVYMMPNEVLFDILAVPPVDSLKYVPLLLLMFLPLSILAYRFIVLKLRNSYLTLGIIMALITCFGYLFSKGFNRLEENKFGMFFATSQSNWDKVLEISEKVEKADHQAAYLTNLALTMKNELPHKMFHYQQLDEHGLFLDRYWDEYVLRYGSYQYYHLGILNEAIRWIFDAAMAGQNEMDYCSLTRLAAWNQENGYKGTADKYFDILERTLMYRSWAKRQRLTTVPQRKETAMPAAEFFIGGRDPIIDMSWYYEYNPKNQMTLEYMLCCLLLKNDLDKFLQLFNLCYPRQANIPQAYQEALVLIASTGKISIKNYPIDNTLPTRLLSFNQLAAKKNHAELKKQFGDTWWYYAWKIKNKIK